MKRQVRHLGFLAGLLILVGCSHQNKITLARGETLAVHSEAGTAIVPRIVPRQLKNKRSSKRSRVGRVITKKVLGKIRKVGRAVDASAVGAVVGAIWGVSMEEMGAPKGVKPGISAKKAKSFNALSAKFLLEERCLAELESTFLERASLRYQIQPVSHQEVTLRLISLTVDQPGKDQVGLSLTTELELVIDGRKRTIRLLHAVPPVYVGLWLDDGAYMRSQLKKVVRTTAQSMVAALAVGV